MESPKTVDLFSNIDAVKPQDGEQLILYPFEDRERINPGIYSYENPKLQINNCMNLQVKF